ncbi:protein Shroom4 isoform X2 [Rhinoderma darwinii]
MQYPSDAFSMSWHSGSEMSEYPLQWNTLSRHCSTDKSSSIGSMESLDHPGQNYYEGTLSPLDPAIYQNKRDSAYSSFSASSITSDYTVSARMDESPINCILGSNKQEVGRYHQTRLVAVDSQMDISRQSLNENFQKDSILYNAHNLETINSPPQPPIRRDSLRENKNPFCNSDSRASAPDDSFNMSGKWSSEAGKFGNSENAFCLCTKGTCTVHLKENLSSDQYYMLSSQTDKAHKRNKFARDDERPPNHCIELKNKWPEDETEVVHSNNLGEVTCSIDHTATENVNHLDCEHWTAVCHHSTQTNLSSVQASFRNDLEPTSSAEGHYPTDKCKEENETRYQCSAKKDLEISQHQNAEQPSVTSGEALCPSLDRSVSMPNETHDTQSLQSNIIGGGLILGCINDTITQDASGQEENVGLIKKPGSSRHRSAQMRRKSDRFATNLRNEIQTQKSQLQKSKGSKVLLSGEESVEERNKVLESCSEIIPPPPPPPKNKALILEMKRDRAGKCRSSNVYFNQGKLEGEIIDKNNETHKHTSKENISLKEAFTEDEEMVLPSQNKTYNDCWTSNDSDTHHQESIFQEKNRIDHRENIKQKFPYSARDIQHNVYMDPKTESFVNQWAPVSTSKSSSLDMWNIESEDRTSSLKIPVEFRDFSVLKGKPSTEVCGPDTCENQPPTETLDKHVHVNNTCYMNNQSFGSEGKWNLPQFTLQQPVTERKIKYQANLGPEKTVKEVRKSDDLSPIAQLKSPQQLSELKDHISQHNPHDARWTWSPEHKLQSHPYIGKGDESKLNGINVEGIYPPITRMSDENILMPFSDRRKFFEDVSKGPTSSSFTLNDKPNKSFCPTFLDCPLSQTKFPDLRRHSIDNTHCTTSPRRQDSGLPHYDVCMNHRVDPPMCCNQGKHSTDYLPALRYGYRVCGLCSNDLCPALLKRNIPVTHHSCHCQHLYQDHHHRWTQCADYLCPAPYNSLEDGGSLHVDQWHIRKPLLQDTSLKEWNQHLKSNRKCSQSVSQLCNFHCGIQHPGSSKSGCEENNHEWSQCYKTTSSCDFSCESLLRPVDFASFQVGHPEPSLSRSRAYSVNQLNMEYLTSRDRMESSTTKLEEREPSARSKKQGPPRPPPPKCEKYKEYQASKQTAKSGFIYCKEKSLPELNRDIKDARQRSQSLPVNRTSCSVERNSSIYGPNHIKEPSENICASQGSHEFSSAASPSQNASVASESKEADERDIIAQLLCSESVTVEPLPTGVHDGLCSPALEQMFEGGFQCSEEDWSTDRESEVSISERCDEFQPSSPTPLCGTVSPTSCATYYNTSAAKADLLNRMKEMTGDKEKTGSVAEEEENEFTFKKVQLIESISRKISVLHEVQEGLQEDINANATLGCELGNLLNRVCKPNEYDKFRIFIGDLDKVVSLLLSLSGRLRRVESALNCEDPEPSMEEKLNLFEKKKQLTDQLEDAKELKAHVTRREQMVLETVSKYLNGEQLQDYRHYVKMTSSLIVEQRELEDKIRLGEEQLRCLRESL